MSVVLLVIVLGTLMYIIEGPIGKNNPGFQDIPPMRLNHAEKFPNRTPKFILNRSSIKDCPKGVIAYALSKQLVVADPETSNQPIAHLAWWLTCQHKTRFFFAFIFYSIFLFHIFRIAGPFFL